MGTDIIFTALMQKGELMDDLISRRALCRYALNQKDKSVTPNDIMRFPSADRPTGEWKYLHGSIGSYMTISCPFCGETFNDVAEWKYNYCPNCRADMRGEEYEID